jgi:hypothetical protein
VGPGPSGAHPGIRIVETHLNNNVVISRLEA